MVIGEYKQIGTKKLEDKEIPIMGIEYREMTESEIEEIKNISNIEEPTTIEDLVEALEILTNIVLGG